MKSFTSFYIFLIAAFIVVSCGDSDDGKITMTYAETKCADPWGTGSSSSEQEVIDAVSEYFTTKMIVVTDIAVSPTGVGEDCEACNCLTGRIIELNVDEAHQSELESEGFEVN